MAEKRLLVGGAAGFVGRNALRYFSKLGLEIVGICRDQSEADEVRGWVEKEALRNVTLVATDMANDEAMGKLFADLKKKWKAVPYVFNAAGGFEFMTLAEADPKKIAFLIQANIYSNLYLLKHAIPLMKEHGFGRIVVVSAAASLNTAGAGMGVYAGTKAMLNCLVQSANAESAGRDVVAECVYPTIIDTPRNRADMPTADTSKWMTVEDVLDEVENLLSESRPPAN